MISELSKAIAALDIPADWIGLRAVKDTASAYRVRDENPETNGKSLTQGVIVEVLVNGQLGYGATNSLKLESLQAAAQSAYHQALTASQWSIHATTLAERPKV